MTSLMVATHGGHISELNSISDRIVGVSDTQWVTSEHAQTTRMMQGRSVEFVPFIDSRDVLGVLKAIRPAISMIRRRRFDRVISTGSGIALAYLPAAALLRVPAHYIESSARVQAPSVTGRLLQYVPGVTTWWQVGAAPKGWRKLPGIFAGFSSQSRTDPQPIRSVVVTVGTTHYQFDRLLRRLLEILPSDVQVFWQLGKTDTTGLDIEAHDVVDEAVLAQQIRDADVVVTHAGSGSLLGCMQAGQFAVCVPRLGSLGEQVDDHQIELAEWAHESGLALRAEASEVTWDDLQTAAALQVSRSSPEAIELDSP